MVLHVLFTKEGIPAWIGTEPLEGCETVEGLTVEYLAAHRRTAKGNWVARLVPVPAEPTAEELAARAEADYQAALAERDRALREALARGFRLPPCVHLAERGHDNRLPCHDRCDLASDRWLLRGSMMAD